MEIKHADKNNFNELTNNGLVLVDFYANWCGPCKMLGTQIEELDLMREDFSIVKINVDEEEELARKFGVMSIPALFLFKDGKLIDNKVGFMSKDDIKDWISNN